MKLPLNTFNLDRNPSTITQSLYLKKKGDCLCSYKFDKGMEETSQESCPAIEVLPELFVMSLLFLG